MISRPRHELRAIIQGDGFTTRGFDGKGGATTVDNLSGHRHLLKVGSIRHSRLNSDLAELLGDVANGKFIPPGGRSSALRFVRGKDMDVILQGILETECLRVGVV